MSYGTYLLAGAGIAGIVGGAYLLRLKKFASNVQVSAKVSLGKVSLTGINLNVTVTITNPTGVTITLGAPLVKILYNGGIIGQSANPSKDYKIPANGHTVVPISINLPYTTLAQNAPALLKEYRQNGTATVNAEISATIDGNIPYATTKNFVLGKTTS